MSERYLIFAEDVKRRVKGLDNQRLLLRVSRSIMPEPSALSTGLWFRATRFARNWITLPLRMV